MSASEPTTAEAFATVREALQFNGCDANAARAAFALLERRMGAMDVGARTLLRRLLDDLDDVSEPTRLSPETHFALNRLQRALTDTPPVFTLEEVESCMQDDQECWKVVRDRLTALRRTP